MTLNDLYLDFRTNYMERRLRESTKRGYATNAMLHILPRFGQLNLQDLNASKLDRLTEELQKTLSNKTIIYVHATLRRMMHYAERREYITRNPYCTFDMPRAEQFRPCILEEDTIKHMLLTVKNTLLEMPVTLGLCYGLRRGEVLGIIVCEDLNANTNVLHIQRSRSREHGATVITHCKTDNSDRYILIRPEHTAMLKSMDEGNMQFAWPFSPTVLDTSFKQLAIKMGFPDLRFHDLRHSYATLMLKKGINPKIVSNVLGHSSVQVTLDLYSHPDVYQQERCLEVL